MLNKFKSRKFILAVISAVSLIVQQGFGIDLDPTSTTSLAGIVIAYILGQSHVDSKGTQNETK